MANEKKSPTAISKKKNAQIKQKSIKKGKDSKDMTANAILQTDRKLKVRLPIKIAVIVLSVLALSCVFEGWRQIQKGLTFSHILVFLGGVVSTAILLWLQGFWIYLEEKYKGTLRKKITHFDKLEEYWQREKNPK